MQHSLYIMKFFKIIGALSIFTLASFSVNAAEIFGGYANGCIRGAQELSSADNFQIQVWGQGRNYGHPELISYIQSLAKRVSHNKLPNLLVGDLSNRYGGPFGQGSSHGSHNTGLDVDISFDSSSPKKSAQELANPKDVYLVDTKQRPTKNFDINKVKLIYLAAIDNRVERIFVAPGIKRGLCQSFKGDDRSWLSKIRPWFGHRAHMHVRLKCPKDSPNCIAQAPVPKGDGCGEELASWFEPPKSVAKDQKPKVVKKPKVLPVQCKAVLSGR